MLPLHFVTSLNTLSEVDQAAALIRTHSNPFVRKRLENLLEGKSVSGLFQKRMVSLVEQSAPDVLEEQIAAYLPTFIQNVLVPFVQICGFQVKNDPTSDIPIYVVFGQWWAAGRELTESTAVEPVPYTFTEVMSLLRRGLDYHPTSVPLYMTIAHNYYQEMDAAFAAEEWSRVLTYARVGDYHLQKALEIDPNFEPQSVRVLLQKKQAKVEATEEILQKAGVG